MNQSIRFLTLSIILLLATFSSAHAGDVTIPHSFTAGTPAVAAEVNDNFTAVENAVDDNNSRIAALEAALATLQATVTDQASTISSLQNSLAVLENSEVMALDAYMTVDEFSDPRGPLVQLTGVNLQIVNGAGNTDSINGRGNLIIGYDEVNDDDEIYRCSNGEYSNQTSCENAGETWSYSHKSGSHYLILGSENSYSQYGGVVAGRRNFAIGGYSSVSGGHDNTASGSYSCISGGGDNSASGSVSSVSGGGGNTASGSYSCVSGGYINTASNSYSSVSGGRDNTASGNVSSVSGGQSNAASGSVSCVSGGYTNTASGSYSCVSGGDTRRASGEYDWVAGTLFEDE